MIPDTQSPQISQKQDEHKIYIIMKTTYPPGYHHNGFVATYALGHMMKPYPMIIYIYIYYIYIIYIYIKCICVYIYIYILIHRHD